MTEQRAWGRMRVSYISSMQHDLVLMVFMVFMVGR